MRLNGVPPSPVQKRHGHPLRHGVEHGDGNFRALIRRGAGNQSLKNGLIGIQACSHIDDRNADPRRTFRTARHRRDPGFSLNQKVIGFTLGVRAALAIT
jgi:hypothetical protein